MKENQDLTISFDFVNMRWEGLTVKQIQLWEYLYPKVDVVNELKFEMVRWLDTKMKYDKPSRIARKKNWKAFICNWLKREQIKAVGL